MKTQYTINAYSPSLNQSIREFNLHPGEDDVQDPAYADKLAEAFAYRLNQQQHMHATDWIGQAKFEQVGVETLPNYLFHTNV